MDYLKFQRPLHSGHEFVVGRTSDENFPEKFKSENFLENFPENFSFFL
jgi:hypothetical protein